MRSVFGDPHYADVQAALMHEVARQRILLKEPTKDDPASFGSTEDLRASDAQLRNKPGHSSPIFAAP